MGVYKFSKEGAKRYVSRRMLNRIPIIIISVVIGLFLPMYRGVNIFENKIVLLSVLLLLVLSIIIGILVGYRIGIKGALNTDYILTDEEVKFISPIKTISIDINNIDSGKSLKKGFVIKEGYKVILIPIELNDYSEIVNFLSKRIA